MKQLIIAGRQPAKVSVAIGKPPLHHYISLIVNDPPGITLAGRLGDYHPLARNKDIPRMRRERMWNATALALTSDSKACTGN
jgi:hypothetical protein